MHDGDVVTDQPEGIITLEFIGRQLERVLGEQGDLRAEMAAQRARLDVLTAAVLRIDQTMQAILTELAAIHVELAGFDRRLHKQEAKP